MRLLLFACLVACTEEIEPESGIEPTGGVYGIQSTLSENGCASWGASFNDSYDGASVEVSFPDETTARFHWLNVQDCSRNENAVDCSTDEPLLLDDYAPDNDARIMYEDQTLLTWDTPTHATGQSSIDLNCEGSQCDLISSINEESYPCAIEMSWEMALVE